MCWPQDSFICTRGVNDKHSYTLMEVSTIDLYATQDSTIVFVLRQLMTNIPASSLSRHKCPQQKQNKTKQNKQQNKTNIKKRIQNKPRWAAERQTNKSLANRRMNTFNEVQLPPKLSTSREASCGREVVQRPPHLCPPCHQRNSSATSRVCSVRLAHCPLVSICKNP